VDPRKVLDLSRGLSEKDLRLKVDLRAFNDELLENGPVADDRLEDAYQRRDGLAKVAIEKGL
jgi:hypothetical protein